MIQMSHNRMQQGFTFVELAAVLVTIGLIVGAIISGRQLLEVSRANNVFQAFERYNGINGLFFSKYGAYPGDFREASRFWADCVDDGANLCDGNGNGIIDFTFTTAANAGEDIRAWQHLSLSGMVDQQFSGTASAVSGSEYVPAVNYPALSLINGKNGGVSYSYQVDFGVQNRTGQTFSAGLPVGNAAQGLGSFHPLELRKLDQRVDDDNPETGRLSSANVAGVASGSRCVESGNWNLETDVSGCYLLFWLDN